MDTDYSSPKYEYGTSSGNTSNSSKGAGVWTISLLLVGLLVLLFVLTPVVMGRIGPNKAVIMNCMPIMGNKMPNGKASDETTGEGFAPVPAYFDTDNLKPKTNSSDPEWAKKFASATNGLLDQNFVDNADSNKYNMTRSSCGRRFMSLDLRRVPVPTRDPTTVTSFGLPYIEPQCVRQWQDTRPALDC